MTDEVANDEVATDEVVIQTDDVATSLSTLKALGEG
jgi:hypothetical protein